MGLRLEQKRRRVLLSADLPAKTAPTAVEEKEETARGHPPPRSQTPSKLQRVPARGCTEQELRKEGSKAPLHPLQPPKDPGVPRSRCPASPLAPPPQPSGAPPPRAAGGLGGSREGLGGGRAMPPPTLTAGVAPQPRPSPSSDARPGAAGAGGGCGARGARGRVRSCGGGGGDTGPLGASGPHPLPAETLEGLSSRAALKSKPHKAPSRIAAPARLHSCCGTPPGKGQNPNSPPGHGDPSPNPPPGGGLMLGTAKPRGKKAPPRNVPFWSAAPRPAHRSTCENPKPKLAVGFAPLLTGSA